MKELRVTPQMLFCAMNPDEAEHADATVARIKLWREAAERLNIALEAAPACQPATAPAETLIAEMKQRFFFESDGCLMPIPTPELFGAMRHWLENILEPGWEKRRGTYDCPRCGLGIPHSNHPVGEHKFTGNFADGGIRCSCGNTFHSPAEMSKHLGLSVNKWFSSEEK